MNKLPNKIHPAVITYRELLLQEPNPAYLHYTLAQQIWLDARGAPDSRPSEYAMVVLRVMSYAFLLSQDLPEDKVHAKLIRVMESFENAYRNLAPCRTKDADHPMRRTRWPGGNVISFPPRGVKRHDDGETD